ncbi:MAG: diguanylate cyclase [Epsilonproteobacteria bacterium]|nr:diguanylate cyclase [Campylobacterota bacterium]
MNDINELIDYATKLNILYVEDNELTRKATQIILNEFFDNIIVGVDGEDGLEKFKTNDIDIIITDIDMPRMDGLAMLGEIRKIDENVSVLIFSAHNDTDFFMNSIHLGVDGYLFKPLELDQFEKAVFKSIRNVKLQKENFEYKNKLEQKVREQVNILRDKEQELEVKSRQAHYDQLTSIYNRHRFNELFEIEKERTDRSNGIMSIVIIDIDDFKKINDTYGHNVGDIVLKTFSQLIQNKIRISDILARWGGEEFVILLPDTDVSGGYETAEQVRKVIESHKFSTVGKVTASFGVAEYEHKQSLEELVKRCDKALYIAKSGGKNQVVKY